MAIGSDPEIGTTFRVGMSPDEARQWAVRWRALVGDDLLGGYGTLCYPDRSKVDLTDDTEDAIIPSVPVEST